MSRVLTISVGFSIGLGLTLLSSLTPKTQADTVCADSSYVQVHMSRTFTGHYRRGEPFNVLTIVPNRAGESLAQNGIRIEVYLRNCAGEPLVDFPRQDIVVQATGACFCPGGNIADAATDATGMAVFTGNFIGGGCASELEVVADGIVIDTVPIALNSPDSHLSGACWIDSHEIIFFRWSLGTRVGHEQYTICFDLNEDGRIDASDLAYLARHFGTLCSYPKGSR